jgi:hypothetical protein
MLQNLCTDLLTSFKAYSGIEKVDQSNLESVKETIQKILTQLNLTPTQSSAP